MFSTGAPLGWIFIQWWYGVDIYQDIWTHLELYSYLLFATMIVFACFGAFIGKQQQHLEKLALRDPLTTCYNSRYFHERLHEEVETAKRNHFRFSIIAFNLDYLRRMNQSFGHQGVNVYLSSLCRGIKKQLRSNDILARISDGEFVLLVPHTAQESAQLLAKRLCGYIESFEIPAGEYSKLHTTASFGIAHYHPPQTSSDIIHQALMALKQAKFRGRNQVVVHNHPNNQ